ncbi:hypothetical protein [Hydrogenophaga sp. RWCD_12]|uniref:hypothetical protein n=1 Tax=Hydrogenophaga sp. RWCD_12 TaxID=3391190 RepID=UPI00398498F3
MPDPGRLPVGLSVSWRVALALCVLAAIALTWLSVTANLDFACQNRQWPVVDGCPASSSASAPGAAGPEWDRLRERVANNPGDGLAMADMVRYAGLPPETIGMDGGRLIDLVSRVAPFRDEVLKQQVVRALSRQDWAQAVPFLVQLAVRHGDAEASRSLARLMVLSSQDPALLDVLRSASQGNVDWVNRALRVIPAEKLPMWATLPLVVEVLQRDGIQSATGLLVVRQLKAEARWLDAHAVWLQLWKRPLDLIYNGGFDREFVRDAFDWDLAEGDPARVGAEVERVGMGPRGQVLRIRFNGRPLRMPLLKHDLLLPAGVYHFEGDFRARELPSAQGLVWTFTCAQGGGELARSVAMQSTDSEWSRTSMELTIGSDCQALTLALVPKSEADVRGGLRGELLLDRVVLTRLVGGIAANVKR